MQQIHLQSKNAPLESKLKEKKISIFTQVVKKGKKRVVRHFHKRRFGSNALVSHKKGGNSRDRMEKRMLSKFLRRKGYKKCTIIHVQSTHNNTIYTISRNEGKTNCCISTGMCGFKNTRKSTSYASQVAAERLGIMAKRYTHVHIKMRGLGPGKLSGVRALYGSGFRVTKIRECTLLPHNGCRPPKCRRL